MKCMLYLFFTKLQVHEDHGNIALFQCNANYWTSFKRLKGSSIIRVRHYNGLWMS